MLLQQAENHRRGDVIGQVGAHAHRAAPELLLDELGQIQLHHVAGDDFHVVPAGQSLLQHGEQPGVQLDGADLLRHLRQLPGEHANARAHLDDALAVPGAAGLGHAGAHGGVDEEVLPQGLGKVEPVAGKHLFDAAGVGEAACGLCLVAHGMSSCSVTWYSTRLPSS